MGGGAVLVVFEEVVDPPVDVVVTSVDDVVAVDVVEELVYTIDVKTNRAWLHWPVSSCA